MNKLYLITLLGIMVIVVSPVLAFDFTGWKQIQVDEILINQTSGTSYTVMIPPGFTNKTEDSIAGPMTTIVNASDPHSLLSIVVADNPAGAKFNDTYAKVYLDNFMSGANMTPIEGYEPEYIDEGCIMNYGSHGDEVGGAYIRSTDEKVIIVSGFYKTINDAIAGSQNFALVAGTIELIP